MFVEKKEVVFYEKPGCQGNKKQKALLSSHGITLEVKSILDTPWSKEHLKLFFNGLDNSAIVNQFAPQVKKGEIDINSLSQEELIEMMIDNPILIKRPLIEFNKHKICGFDIERLNTLLKVDLNATDTISVCQSSTQECSPS